MQHFNSILLHQTRRTDYNLTMFRLTRAVRFAVNADTREQQRLLRGKPTNGYAGFPSLTGIGHFFALECTVTGPLDDRSEYLVNIKQIDAAVRDRAISLVDSFVRQANSGPFDKMRIGPARLAASLFDALGDGWPAAVRLESLRLVLSPFLSVSCFASELPMVRFSQKFEFSASHRLHNPALSPQENQEIFGKCNNPHGHGHNYEVQVTLSGIPDDTGSLVAVPRFEQIVAQTVIDRFDHRNLNVELEEFRTLIPTVENIAMTIYRLLKPAFEAERVTLAGVTVWETPKTWCEYSE
jgi:6-pyruvoyltetrahydropterin/6-carboxytetrahydropterin synthase